MIRKSFLVGAAGLLVSLAACENSTGLSNELTQADANQLAADMAAAGSLSSSDVSPSASFNIVIGRAGSAAASVAPVVIDDQFSVTKQCPKGGQIAVSGTSNGTADQATQSLAVDVVATRTDTDCGFQTRHGVLTLSGTIAYTGHLNIVNAQLSGLQTQTHKGSFTWARGGASGECVVDLASSWDPATHTAKVSGTFCEFTVDVTRTITA